MAMKVRSLSQSKIESSVRSVYGTQPQSSANAEADTEVSVIVKVREPNYVPEGMTIRSRINELIFTANAVLSVLAKAERDPLVESIGAPRPIFADKDPR